MTESTIWWLLTAGLVALELFTGTFYLLMLAIGMAAGALAAHMGFSLTGQLVVAAIIGSAAVVCGYFLRKRRKGDPSARADRSVNLDVGEKIQIDSWQADGTSSVRYRGATWAVALAPGQTQESGMYRVVELMGNRLVVEKA